ncbi:MAG: hypothetical protein KAG43_04065, partial [Candidatus Marithrix sp.]|nr:hypothetical protein [Candidatus Marithrix sp.]
VLTSGDKHKTDISIIDFRPKKLDGTYISETQHKIIYICPKYVNSKTPESCREWLQAIDDSLAEQVEEQDYHNEILQEVFSLIKKDKITPGEYARMKNEYSDEEYVQEQTQKARNEGMEKGIEKGLEKGMEKGLEKGMEKGLEKGMEKGIEKGLEKGMEKGVLLMAKNMKQAQVATTTIAEVTDLSIEQINGL